MQDRNELQEIVNAKTGTLDDLAKEPMPATAVQRTIGLLPQKGEIVKLRGLDFTVRFVNNRTGELRLTLIRDAQQAVGAIGASPTEDVEEKLQTLREELEQAKNAP